MDLILSIYIAFTVLSVCAIILDFFGLIEHHSHSSDIPFERAGHESNHQPESHPHMSHLDKAENIITPAKYEEKSILIRFFSAIRMSIYFFLGFGPAGWVAYYYSSSGGSFLYSIPTGIAVLFIVKFIRKFVRKDLDSLLNDNELYMTNGTVIVTIPEGQLGKVRITIDGSFYDRFAKGKDPQKKYSLNTPVQVVEVESEYLVVKEIE